MNSKRDYLYDLPPERIAQKPAERRDGSRLLHVTESAAIDRTFTDVVDLLPENALLVFNNIKVLPARLHTHKPTGGAVELLLLEPADDAGSEWVCLAKSSKPLREGATLALGEGLELTVVRGRGSDGTVVVAFPGDAYAAIERYGEVPLPPYIDREHGADDVDHDRYQTVYAEVPGAVAAPTAGLHFTEQLLEQLSGAGHELAYVTLYVGWGTFAPIRTDDLSEHVMHAERYSIPARTAELLATERPVVAVGTTAVRALESYAAARQTDAVLSTNLFIRPGYEFQLVDHLITNFHLPGSTLLMLVSAFAGHQRVMDAYRQAVSREYRFYSYGDAMLLSREVTA